MRNRFLLLAAASLVAALPAFAHSGRWGHHGWNTSTHGELRSCADISVDSDDFQVARDQEQFTVPKSNGTFNVNPGQNGGVVVRGSDRKDYGVTVCKFAGGRDEAAAKSALAQISAKAVGDSIHAQGPKGSDDDDSSRWMVYLIIEAPRDAAMSLETQNGPLSVEDYSGSITAKTQNGPLALKNISGDANASVQNGPISISGSSGKAHIEAQNGPLSVDLTGSRWEGQGLVASTVNGPVSVSVPENYGSGVVVDSDGHSPMRCSAKQCESQGSRTWDDEDRRRIAINGNAPALVKVSTVNGPVSVDNGERRARY